MLATFYQTINVGTLMKEEDMLSKSKFIAACYKILSAWTGISNWIALSVVLTFMMLFINYDILLRYAFNSPLEWGTELSGLILVAIVFWSIGYCYVQGGHIRVEIVLNMLGPRWRKIVERVTAGIALFFWGSLFYQTCIDIGSAIEFNEIGYSSEIKLWPFRVIMAVGLLTFCLELLFVLLRGEQKRKWN